MNALELDVRRRHRNMGERPWQRFGRCSTCGRTHGEDGRPLWLTGRRPSALECLECYDLAPSRRAA